ncbi:phosphatase PAP2 family protein [Paraburkholderia phosphatilytica]|uniref:phosphatase PAP2 family protein n=1 Tax=Paraburkholderia phosphatilytica TaxID=2282883 RepID=UPI000E518041|nr:phosphatase PAP2 family protein [Paraburkholderia phosphatilytica]
MSGLSLHQWYSITSFGGPGLTLPLALAIAFWLGFGHTWRMAFGWLLMLCIAVSLVTVTKIAFLGWGVGVRSLDFTGVSGHAALSTTVYPVALFLVLLPARRSVRILGVLLGLGIGVAVGLSRVVLAAHSPSEAVAGCVVGGLTALLFVCWHWHAQPGDMPAWPVAASLAMLAFTLHGVQVPTQRWVTHIALKMSGHERPYIRARWKAGYGYAPVHAPSVPAPFPQTQTHDEDSAPALPPASHSTI